MLFNHLYIQKVKLGGKMLLVIYK